jgi:hypothetical protein
MLWSWMKLHSSYATPAARELLSYAAYANAHHQLPLLLLLLPPPLLLCRQACALPSLVTLHSRQQPHCSCCPS